MMPALALLLRVTQDTTVPAFIGDLTALARKFRHSTRALGGYYRASFEISQEDFTRTELEQFYKTMLGCRLKGTSYGTVSWEGEVFDMRLLSKGVEAQHTLARRLFRNIVDVWYSDDVGERTKIGESENTDSSGIFGESKYIKSISGSSSTGATNLRDSLLTEFAWPRSRIIGGDAREYVAEAPPPDLLRVICAGYWESVGRRWRTTDETGGISTIITNLIGESEFVTAGRIETNSDSVTLEAADRPKRLTDSIEELVELGDSNGNIWHCGVYEGRKLVYETAPTTWAYQLRNGILLDQAGNLVDLSLVKPGFLVRTDIATGWVRPGDITGDQDDPQVGYVDEVAYKRGDRFDELRMHYAGTEESAAMIARRIRTGNI